MTRNEFLDSVTEWWELKEFCENENCDICEDIVSDDDRDEQIDNDVADEIREESWATIRDYLDDITTGYGYYRYNGRFDYDGLDNEDFERYKNDVLDWADDNGAWDDEENDVFEEELACDSDEDDEPAPEDEDFSVGDLIGMCCVAFATIQAEDVRRAREEEEELRRLYPKVLK